MQRYLHLWHLMYKFTNTIKAYIMESKYISPDMEILDIMSEGELCSSNELLEEIEGEW